jgi:short-subunit dehydrogenase
MGYSTAIVTGASRGIGLALGRVFLSRGLNVILAARTPPPELTEHWIETDVAEEESVRGLVAAARERFGRVDVLVNNAGIGWARSFAETDVETIRRTIDVNLLGALLCTRAVLPDMLAARRGLIVNIGSDLSRRFSPGLAVYTATKFGLLGFSGSLLREVKDQGVKVTAILPGVVDTAFGDFGAEASRDPQRGIPPAWLADKIAAVLDDPDELVVDELILHPIGQQGF